MLVSTAAIVLHSFKYGDTSKIVRLLTREHGVQSAIAKGAFRPKSRFGARLQSLSQGVAQLYLKQTRDLQTLAGFDLTAQRAALAKDVRRYAAAAALSELVLRLSPEERHPEIFDLLSESLDRLAEAPDEQVGLIGLAAMWRMIATLGFSPSLDSCARDGRPLPEGAARFSVTDGGLLCATCAAGTDAPKLPHEERRLLERLVTGDLPTEEDPDAGAKRRESGDSPSPVEPAMTPSAAKGKGRGARGEAKREAAHRRLLARFVRRHASEDRELPALAFWETHS
ncbi:MAG: DNA repair protein RecO [Gemmatimonadetes bacterium]|nr:DNA repair protein RecO [Gemmatimonadota bacterium]